MIINIIPPQKKVILNTRKKFVFFGSSCFSKWWINRIFFSFLYSKFNWWALFTFILFQNSIITLLQWIIWILLGFFYSFFSFYFHPISLEVHSSCHSFISSNFFFISVVSHWIHFHHQKNDDGNEREREGILFSKDSFKNNKE